MVLFQHVCSLWGIPWQTQPFQDPISSHFEMSLNNFYFVIFHPFKSVGRYVSFRNPTPRLPSQVVHNKRGIFLHKLPYFRSTTCPLNFLKSFDSGFMEIFPYESLKYHSLEWEISSDTSLAPGDILTIKGFLIPNPPFSFWNWTAFELMRWKFLSLFFPPCHRKFWIIILIRFNINFGANKPEHGYIAR